MATLGTGRQGAGDDGRRKTRGGARPAADGQNCDKGPDIASFMAAWSSEEPGKWKPSGRPLSRPEDPAAASIYAALVERSEDDRTLAAVAPQRPLIRITLSPDRASLGLVIPSAAGSSFRLAIVARAVMAHPAPARSEVQTPTVPLVLAASERTCKPAISAGTVKQARVAIRDTGTQCEPAGDER